MNVRYLMAAWRLTLVVLLGAIVWQLTVTNRYLKIQANKDELSLSAVEAGIDQIHSDLEDIETTLESKALSCRPRSSRVPPRSTGLRHAESSGSGLLLALRKPDRPAKLRQQLKED